jgi:hypothetical protein
MISQRTSKSHGYFITNMKAGVADQNRSNTAASEGDRFHKGIPQSSSEKRCREVQ